MAWQDRFACVHAPEVDRSERILFVPASPRWTPMVVRFIRATLRRQCRQALDIFETALTAA
jgi:hypothetical protein